MKLETHLTVNLQLNLKTFSVFILTEDSPNVYPKIDIPILNIVCMSSPYISKLIAQLAGNKNTNKNHLQLLMSTPASQSHVQCDDIYKFLYFRMQLL